MDVILTRDRLPSPNVDVLVWRNGNRKPFGLGYIDKKGDWYETAHPEAGVIKNVTRWAATDDLEKAVGKDEKVTRCCYCQTIVADGYRCPNHPDGILEEYEFKPPE